MPSISLPSLNIAGIEEGLKSQDTLNNILDTLQLYRKELNFLLMNLDTDNMPIVSDTLDGIDSTLIDHSGNFSVINQDLGQISIAVGNNSGDIASLVITAQGLQSQVSNQAGDISTLTQTAQGLQSQVTSVSGTVGTNSSRITQLSNEISSIVSFTDVNGNQIASKINQSATTVEIEASKIKLTGITTIHSPNQPNTDYFTFFGNGVTLYENGVSRVSIYHDGIRPKISGDIEFPGSIAFSNAVNFSAATVSGLALRFA